MMKAITEPFIGSSSPVVSDVMNTEEGEGDTTDDNRGRSRARRRTAREIAVMFEQLKQRHITRKREWLEEKEELLTKLKTAEDSKRVLDGLKIVLLNLRTELQDEENRRLLLEDSYAKDKEEWENEKEELLKELEKYRGQNNSLLSKDGDMIKLRKKIKEQDNEIMEWKIKMVDMQRKLTTQDKVHKEKYKSKDQALLRERGEWEKMKLEMEEQIQSLRESAESSDVLQSPPIQSDKQKSLIEKSETVNNTKDKYDKFHKTVEDALREIEKVSDDLRNIDRGSPKSTDGKLSIDGKLTETDGHLSSLSCSDVTTRSDHSTAETTSTLKNTESTYDSSMSNSSMNTIRTHLRITPPLSKSPKTIKDQKTQRRISQVDITVSSPEIKELTATPPGKDFGSNYSPFYPITESDALVTSPDSTSKVTPNFIENEITFNRSPMRSLSHTSSDGTAPFFNRGRSTSSEMPHATVRGLKKYDSLNDSRASLNSNVSKSSIGQIGNRSVSPKLPKLHQQLLFKGRELPKEQLSLNRFTPSLVGTRQASFAESHSSSNNEGSHSRAKSIDNYEGCNTSDKDDTLKGYTPYFDPKVGYVPKTKSHTNAQHRFSNPHLNLLEGRRGSDQLASEKASKLFPDDNRQRRHQPLPPPVVHPKPKIELEKDELGNILAVRKGSKYEHEIPSLPQSDKVQVSDFIEKPPSPTTNKKEEYSTGSMTRGKRWIKKCLNIKDNKSAKPQEEDKKMDQLSVGSSQRDTRGRSSAFHSPQVKHKQKMFKRRSRSAHGQSSSDESDENITKRESFLSWKNRKKNKNKQTDGTKGKRTYTRSNTDATAGFEMRNFLSRFKTSQSNPKKPSVVKQFELKLLENEVKQVDEGVGNNRNISATKPKTFSEMKKDKQQKKAVEYAREAEWNNNTGRIKNSTVAPRLDMSPKTRKPKPETPAAANSVKLRSRGGYTKSGKPSYRRSMSDMHTVDAVLNEKRNQHASRNIENLSPAVKDEVVPREAKSVIPKSAVSSMITRFGSDYREKPQQRESPVTRFGPGRNSLRDEPSAFVPHKPQRERSSTLHGTYSLTKPVLTRFNSHTAINESPKMVEKPPLKSPTRPKKKVEFQNKVSIVEAALKKPRPKPKRYRRADTQPIRSPGFDSTETESESDVTTKENERYVPSSTSQISEPRFSKPLAPGSRRLPSRWAR